MTDQADIRAAMLEAQARISSESFKHFERVYTDELQDWLAQVPNDTDDLAVEANMLDWFLTYTQVDDGSTSPKCRVPHPDGHWFTVPTDAPAPVEAPRRSFRLPQFSWNTYLMIAGGLLLFVALWKGSTLGTSARPENPTPPPTAQPRSSGPIPYDDPSFPAGDTATGVLRQVGTQVEGTVGGIQVAVSDLATPLNIQIPDAGAFPVSPAAGDAFRAPDKADQGLWLSESRINRAFFLPGSARAALEALEQGDPIIERVQAGEARTYLVDDVFEVHSLELDIFSQRDARVLLITPRDADRFLVVTPTIAVERE